MQLKLNINIIKELDNLNYALKTNEIINQLFITNNFDSNDFKTIKYLDLDYVFNSTDIFNINNLLNSYNIILNEVSFIYISIQDINSETINENNLRFNLSIGNVNLNLSQFILFNLEDFDKDISILNIDIPEGKEGIMKIIIGQKPEIDESI